MKLSDEDKREIIRLYKEEGVSQTHLAEAFGVGVRHIADLIARYNLHGEEVLIKKSYGLCKDKTTYSWRFPTDFICIPVQHCALLNI